MQAARYLVVGGVELAAGVQHSENDLDSWHFFAVDDLVVHRDAAAVIDDGNGVVDVDGDIDASRMSAECFIDGVIDDLVNQVVKAHFAGRTDVHGRASTERPQALRVP